MSGSKKEFGVPVWKQMLDEKWASLMAALGNTHDGERFRRMLEAPVPQGQDLLSLLGVPKEFLGEDEAQHRAGRKVCSGTLRAEVPRCPAAPTPPPVPVQSLPDSCGRPGCPLYQERPSVFTPDRPCPHCGYPGLKSLGNTCRHPQLRYILNGPNAGKFGCLEPGCKAVFESRCHHPEFHAKLRAKLKAVLRGPDQLQAGAWVAFADSDVPRHGYEPWKNPAEGFFVAYFFVDSRGPLYDLLRPVNEEAKPPWDGMLPQPIPASRALQAAGPSAQPPSPSAQLPPPPPPGRSIIQPPPQVTACPPAKGPPKP
jgi:hypothetical protein